MALSEAEKKRRNREASKRYRDAHKEKIRDYRAAYYAEHREQARDTHAAYRATNGDAIRAYRAAYYASPRGRATVAAYYAENKEVILAHMAKYRAAPKGKAADARKKAKRRGLLAATECTLTVEEWQSILEMNGHRCFYCGKRRKLTQDHVIPISKGGPHVKENIVPACRQCNSSKSNKIIFLA